MLFKCSKSGSKITPCIPKIVLSLLVVTRGQYPLFLVFVKILSDLDNLYMKIGFYLNFNLDSKTFSVKLIDIGKFRKS